MKQLKIETTPRVLCGQDKLDRTFAAVAAREGYPMSMPIFAAGHSLGCKLQVILGCAPDPKVDTAVQTRPWLERVQSPPGFKV